MLKHRLLPTPRLHDSVGPYRGSRNCISNKFPANAEGAGTTFWIPLLWCSDFMRWKTKSLSISKSPSNPPTTHHIHFLPLLPIVSSQSNYLKIRSSLYRISELASSSAQSSPASFYCHLGKIHFSSILQHHYKAQHDLPAFLDASQGLFSFLVLFHCILS